MNARILVQLVILFFIPLTVVAQPALEKRSLLNNRVEMLVPKDFKPMTKEMLDFKYPNRAQPDLVLTDENAEVNILINFTPQPIAESQLAQYKDFQIAGLKRNHPDAEWLQNGVKAVNGKKVAYIKFISNAIDQKVFNYYFIRILDGRVLLFSFNCIEKLRITWEPVADQIMESIVLK